MSEQPNSVLLVSEVERYFMERSIALTALVFPENGVYSAVCPEVDVASQGDTETQALGNLKDALTLYLEDLDADEIKAVVARHASQKTRKLELPIPAVAFA